MRVVHLTYYYGNNVSGAPVAAMRLHQALLRHGVDSHVVCVDRREDDVNVHLLPRSRMMSALFYVVPRICWVLTKLLFGRMLMPNVFPLVGFGRLMRALKPDLVHVHHIGQDMVSYGQLERLGVPTVVTMHDLSLLNAVEPYPKADRRFADGFTRDNSRWHERWMFNRKRRLFRCLHPVLIGPSQWVCSMARESLIGRDCPVEEVLNIVDPVYAYAAEDRVPHEKFTLVFGAYGGRANEYKGWSDLAAALEILPREVKAGMVVEVFGESAADCEVGGVKVKFLGSFSDPRELRALHHRSDTLALPSRQDNAPQVKFEALLDGLPVIAFERTGCAEFIRHGKNGWIARDADVDGYAKGIEFFYRQWQCGELSALHAQIAAEASAAFNEAATVGKTLAVYSAVGRKGG